MTHDVKNIGYKTILRDKSSDSIAIRTHNVNFLDRSTDSFDSHDGIIKANMTRDEVLSTLGYHTNRVQKPANSVNIIKSDACHFCGRKVYPIEKIDIGDIYHRGCFRCHTCGLQLSLKTFCRVSGDGGTKEVYCRTHVPKQGISFDKEAIEIQTAIDAQKNSKDKLLKQYTSSPNSYNQTAVEFQQPKNEKNQKIKRRRSLKNHGDFEKFGIYEAQEALEQKHREEENELYSEMLNERNKQLSELEKLLKIEREKTVKDLVSWFEGQEKSKNEKEKGLAKIENFFKEQREQKIKEFLDRMHAEEQEAVTRLTQKQTQEMLLLIEERDREISEKLEDQRQSYSKHNPGAKLEQKFEESDLVLYSDDEVLYKDDSEQPSFDNTNDNDSNNDDDLKLNKTDNKKKIIILDDSNYNSYDNDKTEKWIYNDDVKINVVEKPISKKNDDIFGPESSFKALDHSSSSKTKEKVQIQHIDEPISPINEVIDKSSDSDIESDSKLSNKTLDKLKFLTSKKNIIKRTVSDDVEESKPDDTNNLNVSSYLIEKEKNKDFKSSKKNKDEIVLPSTKDNSNKVQITISKERIVNEKSESFVNRYSKKGSQIKNVDSDIEETERTPRMSIPPTVKPPVCRKSKLYKDPKIFKDFDKNALEEAMKEPKSFTDLIRKLSVNCENDMQVLRVIFRWITAKDLNKMEFTGSPSGDTPMGLLRGIKSGTETYHNLFKRLCSYAGIHCSLIDGYSKGAGYRPGSIFKGNRFRNQWTAVWLNNSWRFINCNWGARHVKRAHDSKPTYKIDEFYFLTDPEDHIQQHFPDDAKWQLLRQPITMQEFVALPVVKSPFFNHGLSFVSNEIASIVSTDSSGTAEVRIQLPTSHNQNYLGFASTLISKQRPGHPESELPNRTMIRTIGRHQVAIVATVPTAGKYYCDVFVDSENSPENMDNACSFLIYCNHINDDAVKIISYPQVSSFGLMPESEKFGLSLSSDYDPYFLLTSSAEATLSIIKLEQTKINHTFRYWQEEQNTYLNFDKFAMIYSRNNDKCNYLVRCPQKGLYVLSILGHNEASQSKQTLIFRYIIHCQTQINKSYNPLPRATSRWSNCVLLEPLIGELPQHTQVPFKIESSTSKEIAVTVGEVWIPLKRNGIIWSGNVLTATNAEKICVFARFESSLKDKYVPLLEYSVKASDVKDEVANLYKYM